MTKEMYVTGIPIIRIDTLIDEKEIPFIITLASASITQQGTIVVDDIPSMSKPIVQDAQHATY